MRERVKMGVDSAIKGENSAEKGENSEQKEEKNKRLSAFIEKHDVKNVMMARQLLLVLLYNLLYNDAYFSTNDFNPSRLVL